MINWQTYAPNPSKPAEPRSGYAFEYEGGDYDSFEEVDNEEWEIVVIDREPKARYVGRTIVDDATVAVWEVPSETAGWRRWIGQQVFVKNPSGWFLSDGNLILGMDREGHEKLLRATKRGIPRGAVQFESEDAARRELTFLRRDGDWPLWSEGAKPVRLEWS